MCVRVVDGEDYLSSFGVRELLCLCVCSDDDEIDCSC